MVNLFQLTCTLLHRRSQLSYHVRLQTLRYSKQKENKQIEVLFAVVW